jgi:hypothetical protein
VAYTSQSASWSTVATQIVAQLVVVTEIDPAHVHLVASDAYDLTDLESRFVYVRYYGLQPVTDAGAGRRARPCSRRVRVYVYTRNQLDSYSDDTVALTADDGHETLELRVLDALDEFVPVDPDDEDVSLVLEPLHPVDSSSGPPERKPEDDNGLVRSHLDFTVTYLPRMQTPQP